MPSSSPASRDIANLFDFDQCNVKPTKSDNVICTFDVSKEIVANLLKITTDELKC